MLARLVHLSDSRLRHVFSTEVGLSPTKYLKLLRLKKARELLKASFLEIKEIATATGFGDVSHFVRDYKAIYGETPSRSRHRDAE